MPRYFVTEHTQNDAAGGAFYFAQHGVRIAGAPNTIVAWKQHQFHGTSLQDCPLGCIGNSRGIPPMIPKSARTVQDVDPANEEPAFSQRGLAIVTSSRLLKTYDTWKAGRCSAKEARDEIISGEGDDDIIYN